MITGTKMKPLLHMNGSGKANLLPPAMETARALRKAQAALREMAPNQRDYYPLGAEAWTAAQDEYVAHAKALEQVLHAVEYHIGHLHRGEGGL